jgi:hypothetical protein
LTGYQDGLDGFGSVSDQGNPIPLILLSCPKPLPGLTVPTSRQFVVPPISGWFEDDAAFEGLLAPRDLPLRVIPDDPAALDGWQFA